MDTGAGEILSLQSCLWWCLFPQVGFHVDPEWISPHFRSQLIPGFDLSRGFMAYKNDKLDLGSSHILGMLI